MRGSCEESNIIGEKKKGLFEEIWGGYNLKKE